MAACLPWTFVTRALSVVWCSATTQILHGNRSMPRGLSLCLPSTKARCAKLSTTTCSMPQWSKPWSLPYSTCKLVFAPCVGLLGSLASPAIGRTLFVSHKSYWSFDNCTNSFPAWHLTMLSPSPSLNPTPKSSSNVVPACSSVSGTDFSPKLKVVPRHNRSHVLRSRSEYVCLGSLVTCGTIWSFSSPQCDNR